MRVGIWDEYARYGYAGLQPDLAHAFCLGLHFIESSRTSRWSTAGRHTYMAPPYQALFMVNLCASLKEQRKILGQGRQSHRSINALKMEGARQYTSEAFNILPRRCRIIMGRGSEEGRIISVTIAGALRHEPPDRCSRSRVVGFTQPTYKLLALQKRTSGRYLLFPWGSKWPKAGITYVL